MKCDYCGSLSHEEPECPILVSQSERALLKAAGPLPAVAAVTGGSAHCLLKPRSPVLGCGRLVGHLTPFQMRVLGNMAEGTWYGDIAEDGISPWPDWIFRRTTQPNVTLACLLDAGAIEKRIHTYPNGTRWRVFRRVPNKTDQTAGGESA